MIAIVIQKHIKHMINIESHPIFDPCVIKILILSIIKTSNPTPITSKRFFSLPRYAVVSGVPLISNNAISDAIIENINIYFHPKNVVITPPNIDAKPEPPQEPMDQNSMHVVYLYRDSMFSLLLKSPA